MYTIRELIFGFEYNAVSRADNGSGDWDDV